MKKLEKRAILCLLLAAFLVLGAAVFTVRLGMEGGNWASYYANRHVFREGRLSVGAVYDRNGILLLKNDKDGQHYNDDRELRIANLHVTGDLDSNIVTGANVAFRSRMIGYNFITGTSGTLLDRLDTETGISWVDRLGSGRKATLTVDAELNRTAYRALAGRNGLVCVYNWKNGEILCLVSSPSFDPADENAAAAAKSGSFLNKAISSCLTPGSIFKLVTMAAAVENLPDLENWTFTCNGKYEVEGEYVTCSAAHGTQNIYDALANSCNCAFASLTLELGPETMQEYADQLGLTSSYDINGIAAAKGQFLFDGAGIQRAWAGIGQYEDQLNPLSMLVYVGSIAGGGTAASPVLLKGSRTSDVELLDAGTAAQLKSLMRNNVKSNYGDSTFPGLELHAKTGTAEVGTGRSPHSWFTGFSGDYAFIVCVENGGSGIGSAAPVANAVLQELKH